MIRQLIGWWHARCRAMDVAILWPQCCREATAASPDAKLAMTLAGGIILSDVDIARAAFAVHAMQDPAWRALGADSIVQAIDALKWRMI